MTAGANGRIALLRGINVGGKNLVSMAELRSALAHAGFEDVRTYIQSGNVALRSDAPAADLEEELEAVLADRLSSPVAVVVVDTEQLQRVVSEAPDGFGDEPHSYKYDVVFLKRPLTPQEALEALEVREGVDRAWEPSFDDPAVVYFARDAEQLTRSRLSRITAKPEYQQMTIRNWRTTTRLLEMLEDE